MVIFINNKIKDTNVPMPKAFIKLGKLEYMEKYIDKSILQVSCGGESGPEARECDYNWVLNIREQCIRKGVPFHFKQTGANFIKDGKHYKIERRLQSKQAKKANIDT